MPFGALLALVLRGARPIPLSRRKCLPKSARLVILGLLLRPVLCGSTPSWRGAWLGELYCLIEAVGRLRRDDGQLRSQRINEAARGGLEGALLALAFEVGLREREPDLAPILTALAHNYRGELERDPQSPVRARLDAVVQVLRSLPQELLDGHGRRFVSGGMNIQGVWTANPNPNP